MALCKYPFYHHYRKAFFGCGQCYICRINKRREWTARLMLEATLHDEKSFVTLTYSNEHLPPGGELVPEDLTKFLKRLRKRLSKNGRKIRYFACGEYGERNNRPHYHAILYGFPETEAHILAGVWRKGGIHVGSVTQESLQYVCGYVLKKGFKKMAYSRDVLEFSRMSLRPGIGADVCNRLARSILESGHVPKQMQMGGDVPGQLRINGKMWPIGRYLRQKLRKEMKIDEERIKAFNAELMRQLSEEKIKEAEASVEFAQEVKALNQARKKRHITEDERRKALIELYNSTKILRSEKLSKIYQQRRILDDV